MRNTHGFPINGSDLQKARFVFAQMGLVAQMYGLKPGSGWPLSQFVIGTHRFCGNDPENTDSLKGAGHWGNCGEWSYAFAEILGGAGVINRVVYGDASCEPGVSAFFGGNDTTVIVEERSKDGGVSRRVFDVFQAAYQSTTGIPTVQTLRDWGDLPLTDEDRWQGESVSWLSDGVGKPCVKDGVTQTVLDAPAARTTPSTRERPPVEDAKKMYVSPRPAPAPGRLGLQVQEVSEELADALGMRQARGALIASVDDEGSAKPSGMRAGDVIVMFDGYDIKEMRDLPRRVAEAPIGKDVQVVVIRNGKAETMTVKVGQAPGGR
jgi:hypothetical protein